jgi:hypothetical protein
MTDQTNYADASDRERARRAAEDIKSAAKEAAASTAGAVKNRLAGELDYRKYKSRQRIHRVAQALRDAGTSANGDDELVGRAMETAASRVERFGDYLDSRDVNQILSDARAMARRRPEIFVGALFLAGVALGRFLRSSPPHNGGFRGDHEREQWADDPYPSPTTGLAP